MGQPFTSLGRSRGFKNWLATDSWLFVKEEDGGGGKGPAVTAAEAGRLQSVHGSAPFFPIAF